MSNGGTARTRGALALATLILVGTSAVSVLTQGPPVEYTGDLISDFVVVRNSGGGPSGAVSWWVSDTVTSAYASRDWGVATDFFVSGDFDGDGFGDIAIWRPDSGSTSGFWILPSATGVGYFVPFGQIGDDPTVVGDYDGDGKTDVAIYRPGASAGDPSYWYYKRSTDGVVILTQWGANGDFPAPGDYDGDGRNDFATQRDGGGGNAIFFLNQTTAGITGTYFGAPTDVIVPGDYDGDGKTDLAVVRGTSGSITWWVRRSSDGVLTSQSWGASATDYPCQGDYDGDGKTDVAIWRPSGTPNESAFWVSKSTGGILVRAFGANGDYPVANYNVH